MLDDDALKAILEGIIYVAPEPVTVEQMLRALEGEARERVKARLAELIADYERAPHGIQIRAVAGGYKFSTKAQHHEVLRKFVKSLKAPIRLSKAALETLSVIAYRQPVTVPEINEVRGVDSSGVIHTLMEKKLVTPAGRKSVIGRPILYRTTRDFLVQFGLKDVSELPSLREFEELARQSLGPELPAESAEPGEEPAGADAPRAAPETPESETREPEGLSESPASEPNP